MRNGWRKKQLGELAELKGRIGWRGLTAKEYTKSGPLFLSVHSLNYGDYVDFRDAYHISENRYLESPEIMLQKDDVLICKDGAGIGKVGIVGELPDRTTINSSLLLIRARKDILPKFLYRCLSSPYFQEIVNSRLNGATTPHLYQRDITEFPVILPPLAEQERIVGILDEAVEGIATAKANAEKNLQNARALFGSHLRSVFPQGGNGWPIKKLGELSEQITDGIHNSPTYVESGIPMLDSKHVKDGFVIDDSQPEKFISSDTDALLAKRCKPRTGDILISSRGSIGKIAIVREDQDFNIMGNMILIRLPEGINREFAAFYLLSQVRHIQSIARGVAQKGLYLNQIREYELPLPPEPKQAQIGKQLDTLSQETQHLASIYERNLAALEALKKSLLHQAFTGKL